MEAFGAQSKTIRAPNLKRGRPDERISDRIKLEKVLGVTVLSNAALDADPNSGNVSYPAGCTVVLFNTHTGRQNHIINACKKSITSLAYSSCGRYLVTGECGHQPAVRVWDLQSEQQPGIQQIAECQAHKYGINCVSFSPNSKFVVSIGTQHDMIVNVWDWKSNIKVASNKVSTKVKALAFAENGSYFVTVGNRHVKFWYLEYGKNKYKEAVPLMGRSAILGEQRNNYFCDVACGKARCGDSTYAITRSGLLCEFNNRRLLDRWVELRTTSANCIAVGESFIFVGCAEGIVRCFDPSTLRFVTTLPRTHYLGVDVLQGLNIAHMFSPPPDAKYPDATAVAYDEINQKVTCIYNDHSVYVWDVHNIKRVGKSHSFLYHSACIWGVEMVPPQSPLPSGSFLTCSSDDTIRVWTLDKVNEKTARGIYQKNIYSNDVLKVIYVDKELNYLKDLDMSTSNADKQETSYDGRNGVRTIRISPDGRNVASGDRAGNIRIHETTHMTEVCKIEAHDAEVLCLEYTSADTEHKLLASASRDRLIHVFDVNKDYNFLQTLDDHSSSITAVRFLNAHKNLQMVSCGADKSVIFRSLGNASSGTPQFIRSQNATGKTAFYDMEVDAGERHVLTACQDRNVRVYSVNTGKHTKSFKGSTGDDGTLIKVVLDRSGIYLATSCGDKSLSVYDYYTGECMATMCGHSELATGLRFTNDCRRLISASGDGCIFVWRVPHDMVVTMQARLSQQAMRQGKTLDNEVFSDSSNVDFYDTNANTDGDYRFSVGALPSWAKKHISDEISPPVSLTKGVAVPKGRWAQRAERSVGMKSIYTDSVINFPTLLDRRVDSDGSKDSSIDSGTETRNYSALSKQTSMSSITVRSETRRTIFTDDSAVGGSVRDTDIESTAHDADIDSDQEYRQNLYYPNPQQDSLSGSEFTVTNIDADELRKSQRKSKRPAPISITTTSVSGSQDSDDDDDEVSTPSGENTDRNPMSILSLSNESLDQIVNREKYIQSAFENLSADSSSPLNKFSISSQYHTRTNGINPRNVAVINAAKQTKNDTETTKKREELMKRIADTRKKLQSVGYASPLKYSQSTHDLSHIPEKDNWNSPPRKPGDAKSMSLPTNLQLCGCHAKGFPTNFEPPLNKPTRPRKLLLDRTLARYKNKSLPVSPVSEERSFSDYTEIGRRSFESKSAAGIRKICSDIKKFSEDFARRNEQFEPELLRADDDDGNFSSDSLEEFETRAKTAVPPRRCVSNNEIYARPTHDEIPKSQSFYLNPSNKNSQDSILSASCCNSLESVLSNDSDCRSAPLEALFAPIRKPSFGSLPKNYGFENEWFERNSIARSRSMTAEMSEGKTMRTSETQTDFDYEPPPIVKKSNASLDFQQKLLKFENCIARNEKKGIAFFVDSEAKVKKRKGHRKNDENKVNNKCVMDIPSLESKNLQYKSKFCNVLNNRPDCNVEIYQGHSYALVDLKGKKSLHETSSLDRHLFTKNLWEGEKVTHKPPKAVRRNSSKRKTTYEYVKKQDLKKINNLRLNNEDTIELTYKEKNVEQECENSNSIFNELYDSLDKVDPKMEFDSLEININRDEETRLFDSLEPDSIRTDCNVWKKGLERSKTVPKSAPEELLNLQSISCEIDKIQSAIENIKILNEIQRKISKINSLVDIFKQNISSGRVRALSSMYETLRSSETHNDLLKDRAVKYRKRNLSLPNFMERRLNFERDEKKFKKRPEPVSLEGSPDSGLRRACSLSDMSVQGPIVQKRKVEQVSGKAAKGSVQVRTNQRYTKNTSMTRSSSTGMLNQSDSDNESEKKVQSRLMRPTISSQNKVANVKNPPIRKRQSFSVMNLSTVGQEDSSSDETEKPQKPAVPPRTRLSNLENGQPNIPRRHNINKEKNKSNRYERKKFDGEETLKSEDSQYDLLDVSTVPLSKQLCDEVAFQLTKAANNVVELYRRLTDPQSIEQIPNVQKTDMVKNLELSIARTQKTLQDSTLKKFKQNNGNLDVHQVDAVKKLNELMSKDFGNNQTVFVKTMQQYSDVLLGMMQQNIQNSNT